MKKIILVLCLLVIALFVVSCATEVSPDEQEAIDALEGEDGALAGQAVNKNICKTDTDCWNSYLSCYRSECRSQRGSARTTCANNCLAEAPEPQTFCEKVGDCSGVATGGNIVCEEISSTIDRTGYEICENAGFNTCITAWEIFSEKDYESTDGTCSGKIQDDEFNFVKKDCSLTASRSSSCTTNLNHAEPAYGDHEQSFSSNNVVCCKLE